MNAKAQVLNVLMSVLTMISPIGLFAYRFGGLVDNLALYKMSRVDELQADQYGLLLMTRAGYDPYAMLSFMKRLGQQDQEGNDLLNKYFETHPDSSARMSHLQGYPEFTQATPQTWLEQAIHDEGEGRFSYSLHKIDTMVMPKDPNSELGLLHEGEDDLALGDFSEGQQALVKAEHAGNATSTAQSAAQHELALLPKSETPGARLLNPNVGPLIEQVQAASALTKQTQTAVDDRVKLGRDDLHRFDARLQSLEYEIPNLSNVNIRPGSRLEGVMNDLSHMAKDLDAVFDKTDAVMTNSPGMLKDIDSTLNEMQAPLHRKTLTATDLELLPFYPDLLQHLTTAQNDLVSSITAARGSIALGYQSLAPLDDYFRELDRAQLDFGGDLSPSTAQQLRPYAQAAITALDAAAVSAETAQTFYFNAQARQLTSGITMLGVGVSRGRYDTFAKILQQRLGVDVPTYDESVRLGLSTGDITAATWYAAEEKVPVTTVINEERATGKSIVDLAVEKHLSQESLEIIMGIIYEGYVEKPVV